MSGLGLRQGHVGVWVVTPEGGLWLWRVRSFCAARAGRAQVPVHLETIVLGCQAIFSKRLGEDLLFQGWRACELGADTLLGKGSPRGGQGLIFLCGDQSVYLQTRYKGASEEVFPFPDAPLFWREEK